MKELLLAPTTCTYCNTFHFTSQIGLVSTSACIRHAHIGLLLLASMLVPMMSPFDSKGVRCDWSRSWLLISIITPHLQSRPWLLWTVVVVGGGGVLHPQQPDKEHQLLLRWHQSRTLVVPQSFWLLQGHTEGSWCRRRRKQLQEKKTRQQRWS